MTDNAFIEGQLFSNNLVLPLERPRVYYSVVDRIRLNDLIVMEDMSNKNAIMNDATRPLSVDQVRSGLRELAKLHSHYWNFSETTWSDLKWVQPWRASKTFQWLLLYGCKRCSLRLQQHIPAEIMSLGPNELVRQWVQYFNTVKKGPVTLLLTLGLSYNSAVKTDLDGGYEFPIEPYFKKVLLDAMSGSVWPAFVAAAGDWDIHCRMQNKLHIRVAEKSMFNTKCLSM